MGISKRQRFISHSFGIMPFKLEATSFEHQLNISIVGLLEIMYTGGGVLPQDADAYYSCDKRWRIPQKLQVTSVKRYTF